MACKMRLVIALVVLLSVAAGSDGMRPRDEEYLKADPGACVYFFREDLYEGAKFTLVPLGAQGYVAPVTQRRVADTLPFSWESLPVAFKLLGVAEGSVEEWGIKHYVRRCEATATEGNKTFCAYSLESLLEQVTSRLGPRLSAFETRFISDRSGDGNETMQEYTVTAIPFRSKPLSKSISCHLVPYVNIVYYCHENHRPELFKVFLEGEDGTSLDALVACHENTSHWEPDHVAFRVLKVRPREATICHFFGERHFVWVAKD